MKRKPPPPQEPAHKFHNAEQEYLFAILGETYKQTRILRAMNKTVQFIGLIILVTIILGCVVLFLTWPGIF